MLEKKHSYELSILPDNHVRITIFEWIEEDGAQITAPSVTMEQIEKFHSDLRSYAENVSRFAAFVWGYASVEEYNVARDEWIASRPKESYDAIKERIVAENNL